MKTGRIITEDNDVKAILQTCKTIAVVGLSPKTDRDSYRVAQYLKDHGYTIIPIRPAQQEILGEKAYPSLDDVKLSVDIVDVFRKSEDIMPHAEEALRLKPKVFWMQLGIENQEAAGRLTEAGIDVIMNQCIKVEHERLCS
jgi:predicted CoA-binding protein